MWTTWIYGSPRRSTQLFVHVLHELLDLLEVVAAAEVEGPDAAQAWFMHARGGRSVVGECDMRMGRRWGHACVVHAGPCYLCQWLCKTAS